MRSMIVGAVFCCALAACGTGAAGNATSSSVDAAGGAPPAACTGCASDVDCRGEVCGQFQGDSFCAAACPNGDECAAGTTCTQVTTSSGAKTDLCVPNNNQCGPDAPPPPGNKDGGATGSLDSGLPPAKGTVGPDGGTVSSLYFTVVGDTRPAIPNDSSGYPTAIIDQIYTDMAGLATPPLFSVSTGDYQFSALSTTQPSTQMNLYMAARAKFAGQFFPAIGNHECNGLTNSNCGAGNANGVTNNYSAFLSVMLAPIGKTLPYYSINIDGEDGSFTSKFVFIAANAWDDAQSAWLSTVLAVPTTYTFIVRHEPASSNTAPGVTPSEAIIAKYPYTMKIVGHTHLYTRSAQQEVIFGNGGAPLESTQNYGFGLVQQRADKAIQFDMIDYKTLQPDTSFRFAVTPDGASAP